MKYINFYLIRNFKMSGQAILFGWCVNYISIRNGYILIELYFQNRNKALNACRNLELSFTSGNITGVLEAEGEFTMPVRIVNYWVSLSEPKNLLIELKMPH